jgi:YqjK-like protein
VSRARESLRVRRAQLVQRAEFERVEVARELTRWERPLRITDRSLSFVRTLRRAPVLGVALGAGMAALAFVRPGTVVDWIPGGRVIWQLLMGFLAAKPRRRSD